MYVCIGKKNIQLQESIKQENNPAPSSSFKVVWRLEQIGIGGANIDHTIKLPSFVLKAIKVNLLQKVYSSFLYKFYIK